MRKVIWDEKVPPGNASVRTDRRKVLRVPKTIVTGQEIVIRRKSIFFSVLKKKTEQMK